jgi:hypothetical protein
MKNEWDILAHVQRKLAAGATLVEFRYATPSLGGAHGHPGRMMDEEGTEYELGPDFITAVLPAVRENYISYSIDNWDRILSFGTQLPPAPTSRFVNGEEVPIIDLTPYGPARLTGLHITPSDPPLPPSETDEEE